MDFNPTIREQLKEKGISKQDILQQLENFNTGFPDVTLLRPAFVGKGIFRPEEEMINTYIAFFDQEKSNYEIAKFVPASGAASRMFQDLFNFLKDKEETEQIAYFFDRLNQFAFYDDLKKIAAKKDINIKKTASLESKLRIVELLLTEEGLDYGKMPKALLAFHATEGHHHRVVVTPLEEHIIEGIMYAENKMKVQLHFTVSPEHRDGFRKLIEQKKRAYETKNNVEIEIELSTQDSATDQVVVDLNKNPIFDENGKLVFNPGGHGALIENVNRLTQDIIFIKNIDNVRKQKFITIRNKKLLGGILIEVQKTIQKLLQSLEGDNLDLNNAYDFIQKMLQYPIPKEILQSDEKAQRSFVENFLSRPIRVVGMVKNEGEPGGGPYWIEQDGVESLQIIEASQINQNDTNQKKIMQHSTHFNPVDLVCYTRDYKGEKFDLLRYRDDKMGFISKKNKFGQEVLIQELPGLWNGAMGKWITLFVEVPLETFSPVKTVFDLLRKEHQ